MKANRFRIFAYSAFIGIVLMASIGTNLHAQTTGTIKLRKAISYDTLPIVLNETDEVLRNPKNDWRPRYPGGNDSLKAFFYENMVFPMPAIKNGTSGYVQCKIGINRYGNVESVFLVDSLGNGCEAEARRLISLTKWMPAQYSGVATRQTIVVGVPFFLDELNAFWEEKISEPTE
ncbi:MAG: hypothetical protein ACI8ZN_001891 [Bacteroidia bacterium]|jgi:hypothetical protein